MVTEHDQLGVFIGTEPWDPILVSRSCYLITKYRFFFLPLVSFSGELHQELVSRSGEMERTRQVRHLPGRYRGHSVVATDSRVYQDSNRADKGHSSSLEVEQGLILDIGSSKGRYGKILAKSN